jgi:hypothetical protein
VFDAEDDDFTLRLVDSVQDAVGAAARGVDTGEIPAQLLTDPLGVVDQGSGEELNDCCRDALGQS